MTTLQSRNRYLAEYTQNYNQELLTNNNINNILADIMFDSLSSNSAQNVTSNAFVEGANNEITQNIQTCVVAGRDFEAKELKKLVQFF